MMLSTENYSCVAGNNSLHADRHGDSMTDGAPESGEVRLQLKRILDSPDFPASERNRRFFSFVVELSLGGKKASGYDVATKIFGRPACFNASLDPIVRIEAGKLRRDLETYYLKSGKYDPVHIVLPKGRYRAVFLRNGASDIANADILRAALLGLAGDLDEAAKAWCRLPPVCRGMQIGARLLDRICASALNDETVRGLLLSGLLNAARSAAVATGEKVPAPE